MKRWYVVSEVFTRGQWEERQLPPEYRVFKGRRDAEAMADYLRAVRKSGSVRYLVKRRPME